MRTGESVFATSIVVAVLIFFMSLMYVLHQEEVRGDARVQFAMENGLVEEPISRGKSRWVPVE